MSTMMPEGDDIRKAIKWISGELDDKPDQPLQKLIDKAVFKFDLSPKDTEFLMSFFRKMKA